MAAKKSHPPLLFARWPTIGAARKDWAGKIVIDVTNGFMLPPEAQEAEFKEG